MKKIALSGILVLTLCLTNGTKTLAAFQHPGVLSSQAELESLKVAVQTNNGDPRIAGYNKLAAEAIGNLNYTPTPYADVHVIASGGCDEETAFRKDAHALYAHAIKWVVTGNTAHRDKAIEIADAWGHTFSSLISEVDHPNQSTLEASWALPIWIAGAEILKYYDNNASGWSSTYFDSFVQKVLTYVNGNIYQTANWLISKDLSLMAGGVFLNDKTLYDQGYNHVTGQIDQITVNGAIPELSRDFVHSQYVLIGITQCAEIAYQQGDASLFTRTGTRLKTGAEAYVLSVTGAMSPDYFSSSVWARHSAPYEILLNRYTKLGIDVPNVQNYVMNQNRIEDGSEDHFVGWLSATHAITPIGTPDNGVTGNLAYNKTVTTSSEPQPENPATAAVDNNIYTRWSATGYPQWIEVDLGSVQKIGKAEVICYSDRAYKYTIEAKQDQNDSYQLIVDRSANTTGGSTTAPLMDRFVQTDARYIKLTVTGAADYTGLWTSIIEFRLFDGNDVSELIEENKPENNDFCLYTKTSPNIFYINAKTEISSIAIYDCVGTKIFSKSPSSSTDTSVNVSSIKTGIYVYQITEKQGPVHKGKFQIL